MFLDERLSQLESWNLLQQTHMNTHFCRLQSTGSSSRIHGCFLSVMAAKTVTLGQLENLLRDFTQRRRSTRMSYSRSSRVL